MKDKPNLVQMKKRTRREKFNLEAALSRVDAYLERTPMRDLSQFDFDPDLELGNNNPQVSENSVQLLKAVPCSNEDVIISKISMLEEISLYYSLSNLESDKIFNAAVNAAEVSLYASIIAVAGSPFRATDLLLSSVSKPALLTKGLISEGYRITPEELTFLQSAAFPEANDELYPLLGEHGFKKA